ncbi:MAG: M36 family metallopeptidase, partial [Nitrospiria bacterium]
MSRELDCRDCDINKVTADRETELNALAVLASERLSGSHRVRIARFDALTGNSASVKSEAAFAKKGDYIQRALDHVRSIGPVLGLSETQPVEFAADPVIQKMTSGAVAVHLQQQYQGVPIFQASETVRFSPDGKIKETTGSGITIPDLVSVSSRLPVEAAVDRACRHVAVPHDDEQGRHDPFGEAMPLTEIDLTGFKPQVITAFPTPEQPTVLESGPFGDKIKASLLWFLHHDDLQLTWEVLVTLPNDEGQYRTLVDIQNGQILYCRQLNLSITARGNVYHVDGGSNRQMTDFPKPVASYGLPVPNDLPAGFPEPWVETSQSLGNNTHAHLGASGDPVFGTNQNGVMTFNPSNASGNDQKVLNIFYYNCFMHDYFYLLGFREADGNFQHDNFGRGGRAFDRVDARAHSGTVFGTANMSTRNDGLNPVMNMGLVSSTNRHTAMDSSVVFHEFMHGVTNRLVGGPANTRALEAPQSGGMGEGWSDYIPCTINNTTVVGDWVVNRTGGIRGFPYDTNFPDHFGNLGSGRYSEVHNIGEIWAAALLEMNRNIGAVLGVQLVV